MKGRACESIMAKVNCAHERHRCERRQHRRAAVMACLGAAGGAIIIGALLTAIIMSLTASTPPPDPPYPIGQSLAISARTHTAALAYAATEARAEAGDPTPATPEAAPPLEAGPTPAPEAITAEAPGQGGRTWKDMRERVWTYVQAMGIPVAREVSDYFCALAEQGGYDPRLWCCIAMAESTGGRGSSNLYGFCGGAGSPWARPGGGWVAQTEYLHNRITTFYALHVDISRYDHVLFFHHDGDPVSGDPRRIFYVDNVSRWVEGI